MKNLVKRGRKIIGFVWQDKNGQHWYAFGKPSQSQYISFACNSIEQVVARVEMHTNNGNF